MTESNKPLNQMTAIERFGHGISYFEEGRFDEAIAVLKTISSSEDPEIYARALLGIGAAYQTMGKLKKAIKAWSKVRSDKNSEAYAKAQFGIGVAYHALGKLKKAIKAWSKVRHDDNPKAYAGAQFNLGITYKNQDRLGEAIAALSSINHEDDRKTYAKAQRNLGVVYHTLGKLDEAIDAWSKVRNDDPEAYAWAQYNLGVAYKDQGKLKQAIDAWSNVPQDDRKAYAWARFGIGAAYAKSGKLDQAIKTWSNISREEVDPETYTRAQLNLGVAYAKSGEWKQAIKILSNIRREEVDLEIYAEAQLGLGEVYSLDKEKEEQSHEAYDNVREFFYYKSERGFKILKCPVEVRKELHSLAKNTDEVLKSLQIILGFESKVAHYTRPQIAFDLFGDKENDKEPSNFRLSTIRGVNDPTEGLVLNGYWDQQGIPETIHTNDTATFISCFTFNHDNLNQFRLYGKENGREATGVSLVFNKEFFSDQTDTLEFIAGPSTDLSSKSEQIKPNETGKMESDNKKLLIGKSTLYRCIYLDPETGYWTLAQRDKSTFYREDKEKETAENNWIEYSKKISKIEESFKDYLFDNNDSILEKLKTIFKDPNEYGVEEKQKILEAVRFILLPLQYLVKHIAFQEEQECRIMYITQFRDEKIHSDREKQWMYVEYKEKVLPHIDKIWLSPGAAKYQDFFRILLDKGENDDKVRISQNPFRNKE
ncbi:tetratricopeptide repeat protein [Rothia sp. HSID18069]|uniref:tetratricopeptide repeat protein n=1 Tax=Rothia sp. HSID18069 TaxID=2419515 RepID=UPI000F87D891|nr:tetratricopeptide repeat protein [Rothia sp. HSID18069]RUP73256.1 tetratricopeptide repeat protein [Rothia sp. HSID18069]